MKAKPPFKKGQVVYQVTTTCGLICKDRNNTDVNGGIVIARTIDTCGGVQMTFVDAGNDLVFGKQKSTRLAGVKIFDTAEAAFAVLKETSYAYAPKLYTDDSKEWYADCQKALEVYIQQGNA